MTLKKLGYRCDVANNGLEVLEKLEQHPSRFYDLILMDMQMPQMDGLTATSKLFEVYGSEAPLVIALTANAFTTDKENCLKVGMVDFLSKPLNKKELESKLIEHHCKIDSAG